LQRLLADYLTAVSGARSRERRSVYIDSTDSNERQIVAGYMIPVPVWKSSYRLIFGAAGDPTLEGWAIVDNVTSEDWTNVRLSLVSGRPISFVSRLYEPRYIPRPTAELPEERAQAPVLHAGAIEEKEEGRDEERALADVGRQMVMRAAAAEAMPKLAPAPPRRLDLASNIAAVAAAREAGSNTASRER